MPKHRGTADLASVNGAIDHLADIILIEPQAVGLAVEIGLAAHAGGQPVAGAEPDISEVHQRSDCGAECVAARNSV